MCKMSSLFGLLIYTFFALWGCASNQTLKKANQDEYVFYPIPPDKSRVQFLTAITDDHDFEGKEEKFSFADFIIGKKKKKRHKIVKPYGVAIEDGVIYVCDTFNRAVDVLNLKEKKFEYIGNDLRLRLQKPINITIDDEGFKYITDVMLNIVAVLNMSNRFVTSFTSETPWRPTDVAIVEDKAFVTDTLNSVVVVFDKQSGEFLYRIGDKGTNTAKIETATNIAADEEGYLYISETGGYRIQKITQDGRSIKMFGSGIGDSPGQFARPKGIAVDREGLIYSVDALHGVVQVFDQDNNMLMFFGGFGDGPGRLSLPAQVTIDYDNISYFEKYVAPGYEIDYLILVTSQFGKKKLNIYGFLKQGEKGVKVPADE